MLNSPIDSGCLYRSEFKTAMINLGDQDVETRLVTRVAQMIVVKYGQIEIAEFKWSKQATKPGERERIWLNWMCFTVGKYFRKEKKHTGLFENRMPQI